MSPRTAVTAVAIVFLGGFTFLTVATMIKDGIDVLTLLSLGLIALFAVGILGALSSPDDPDD